MLTRRAISPEVGKKLVDRILWWEDYVTRNKGSLNNNPSPGNKAGGLTTILEKSLGAAAPRDFSNIVVNPPALLPGEGLLFKLPLFLVT